MGAEAANEGLGDTDGNTRAWDEPGTPVHAELLGDGRGVWLMPGASDIAVADGRDVRSLNPGCTYRDGVFYILEDGVRKRVWLYAVVAEERPSVAVAE